MIAIVDFAYEQNEDPIALLVDLQEKYPQIKAQVIDVCGPGGGWPVVQFTGDSQSLRELLMRHFYMDPYEIKETINTKETP